MSECPYKNYKFEIDKFIKLLRKPREEFGNFPPCPFVGREVDNDKLMIELFDPLENSLLEIIDRFKKSKYDSILLAQVLTEEMSSTDTYEYENFINTVLKKNGHGNLKCICFNPNDTVEADDYNIRSKAPYFLINIADRLALSKAHKSLLKTKYYDRMSEEYLKYLHVNKEKK